MDLTDASSIKTVLHVQTCTDEMDSSDDKIDSRYTAQCKPSSSKYYVRISIATKYVDEQSSEAGNKVLKTKMTRIVLNEDLNREDDVKWTKNYGVYLKRNKVETYDNLLFGKYSGASHRHQFFDIGQRAF